MAKSVVLEDLVANRKIAAVGVERRMKAEAAVDRKTRMMAIGDQVLRRASSEMIQEEKVVAGQKTE